MSQPNRTLVLTLTAVTDKFRKGIGEAEGSLNGFGERLGKFAKRAGVALAAFGAAAGALAIKVGKDAITAASDLSEEVSKAGVVFGESAEQINAWAESAATAFGQSRRQATAAASNFAIFGKSAGLTGQELVDFSTEFTELASDLASFNNTSPEDAVQALGAALRGESEPIRRYGVLLNENSLRQKAFEMGIISTTKQALEPQQRVLAAQQLILAQTSDAQGDFARTSDGLANSQRILAANLEDVKSVLGEALLPVAERFTGWIVENLPNIIDFAKEMSEKLAPAVTKVGDFIRDRLLPAVAEVWPHIRDFAKFVGDAVASIVEFVREEVAPRARTLMGELREPTKDAAKEISELGAAFRRLNSALSGANGEGPTFLDWIVKFVSLPLQFLIWLVEKLASALERVVTAMALLAELRDPQKAFNGIGAMVGAELPEGFVPGQRMEIPRPRASRRNPPQTVIIDVTGPYDTEGAAREIQRVLEEQARRSGFQPIEFR
jgi:hypothetical protein